MRRGLIAVGLGLAVVGGTAWDALAGGPVRPCLAPLKLRVEDLDMSPDPVPEGQPVQSFSVMLTSEQECTSRIEVRDQKNRLVARGGLGTIKQGRHSYTIPAVRDYRLSEPKTCFKVFAEARATAAASPTTMELPTSGTFCALASVGEVIPGSSKPPPARALPAPAPL